LVIYYFDVIFRRSGFTLSFRAALDAQTASELLLSQEQVDTLRVPATAEGALLEADGGRED
jgi:hypothetical protein